MDYTKNNHYEKEHGQHLFEFMKKNIKKEYVIGFCLLNALKYQVRAGKKEGNSSEKDLGKALDYLKEVPEIEGIIAMSKETKFKALKNEIKDAKERFENWEG